MRIPVANNLWSAIQQWRADDGNLLAAAVAYYAALAFFPILLVLISGLGLVMQYTDWGQNAQEQVLDAIASYASDAVRDAVAGMLKRIESNAALGGPLGVAGLLIAAGALFAHFERAFDRIWNTESPESKGILAAAKNFVFHRLRAFLMLLAVGAMLLLNLVASLVLSGVREFSEGFLPGREWIWGTAQVLASLTINAFVFALLYWMVPKVSVRFREAFQGGVLTACMWELGRWLLASFIMGDKYSAYGLIGSFLGVMLWIYYGSAVVFLGAEYVQVICRECHPSDKTTEGK